MRLPSLPVTKVTRINVVNKMLVIVDFTFIVLLRLRPVVVDSCLPFAEIEKTLAGFVMLFSPKAAELIFSKVLNHLVMIFF